VSYDARDLKAAAYLDIMSIALLSHAEVLARKARHDTNERQTPVI
jgi:hypothetical protein